MKHLESWRISLQTNSSMRKILYQLSSLRKVLVKSHILWMEATMVNGILLVIIPLLAPTYYQMANFINAIQLHGSFEAHHLDNTSHSAITNYIISRMHKIGYDMSSTMFLFSSPKLIINNPEILASLLCCNDAKQTLQLVAIYEAHLYAMHGCLFRFAMWIIQRLFSVVLKAGRHGPVTRLEIFWRDRSPILDGTGRVSGNLKQD